MDSPGHDRQIARVAGIRSLAGVEFDVANIAQSQDDLNAALVQIDELRDQLAVAQQQVHGLATSSASMALQSTIPPAPSSAFPSGGSGPPPSPRLAPAGSASPSLSSISRLLATMKNQADETDKSLRRSKGHNERFLEQVGRHVKLTPPEELFGGAAQAEAESASIDSDTSHR